MEIKPTLRMLRLAKGWSQEQLAERVQVHPTMIRRYEEGETTPKVSTARRYAEVLGIELDELVDLIEQAKAS